MTADSLKLACLKRIEECYTIAEKEFDTVIPRIPVVFSNKLTSSGGYFRFLRGANHIFPVEIKLSMQILKDNGEDFIREVPGHEVAHYVASLVLGSKGHDRPWRQVMRMFGQDPNRCHNLKITKRTHRKYVAFCACKEHQITKHRVNQIQAGQRLYCRICKVDLTLDDRRKAHEDAVQSVAAAARANAPKQSTQTKTKKGSKAEQVREIIRANPGASVARLCELVYKANIGIPTANIKRYVVGNKERLGL